MSKAIRKYGMLVGVAGVVCGAGLVLAAGMVWAGQAGAQGQGKAAAEQKAGETPRLRVTSRLVQVSVVVQKDGKPVEGLTAEDFVLTENGVEQPIRVFVVEKRGGGVAPEKALPANTFTNRREEPEERRGSVTAILIDTFNTTNTDQALARPHVVKFLEGMEPSDRIALTVLVRTGLHVLHDFTNDSQALLKAFDRFQVGRSGIGPPRGGDPAPSAPPSRESATDAMANPAGLEEMLASTQHDIEAERAGLRTRGTLDAIRALAMHLARIPGRKNLVLLSSGFPLVVGPGGVYGPAGLTSNPNSAERERTFGRELSRSMQAVNDANVSIYAVDTKGLFGYSMFSADTPIRGRGPFNPAGAQFGNKRHTTDTLVSVAQETGGRAFYNTNDIAGSMRAAVEDARVTYLLGFYPSHGKWDGNWRRIKVDVKRKGVTVRSRRGYFAVDDTPQNDEEEKTRVEAELRGAAWSPLESTGLGMTVRVTPVLVPGAEQLKVEVRVEPDGLRLMKKEDRWHGDVDFFFVTQGSKGEMLGSENERVTMRMTQAVYEEVMRDGLVLTRDVEMKAGGMKLRVVVREAETGAIGTVTVPVARYFPSPEMKTN